MTGHCTNPNCFVTDGESCVMGNKLPTNCKRWINSSESSKETTSKSLIVSSQSTFRIPWSGNTLGLSDLFNISLRKKPALIGVLGSQDAGKTTLLLGSYLQLLKGEKISSGKFSGSYTLAAWESLASWVRLDDAARAPSFPPHTPRGISRVPGLLHLALRRLDSSYRDILLTDAPGEWFKQWSIREDSSDTEGAQWIVENADAFLVVADCKRLSSNERGNARRELRELIERLKNHVGNRPVILVWAKSDNKPSEEIKNAIRQSLMKLPNVSEFKTTTNAPLTLLKVIDEIIEKALDSPYAQKLEEPILKHQPFESFRGIYENS